MDWLAPLVGSIVLILGFVTAAIIFGKRQFATNETASQSGFYGSLLARDSFSTRGGK